MRWAGRAGARRRRVARGVPSPCMVPGLSEEAAGSAEVGSAEGEGVEDGGAPLPVVLVVVVVVLFKVVLVETVLVRGTGWGRRVCVFGWVRAVVLVAEGADREAEASEE